VLALSALLLWAWGWGATAWAQTPGQLPSKTFSVDFQSATGHNPDIQQVALSGLPSIVLEYDAATYVLQWPDQRSHQRQYWIKNIGNERITGLNYLIKNDNENEVIGSRAGPSRLDPGERLQVSYLFAWSRYFPDITCPEPECFDTITGQEIPRNWLLTVSQCNDVAPDGTCGVSAPSMTVPQKFHCSLAECRSATVECHRSRARFTMM